MKVQNICPILQRESPIDQASLTEGATVQAHDKLQLKTRRDKPRLRMEGSRVVPAGEQESS